MPADSVNASMSEQAQLPYVTKVVLKEAQLHKMGLLLLGHRRALRQHISRDLRIYAVRQCAMMERCRRRTDRGYKCRTAGRN